MTRRLNFKCSKSKTLFTSAAIAMILTSISAQEVQAAEEIYYDEVIAEVAAESTGVVEQGTLDTSISSDEGRAVEDTLVNVQVDSVGQDSEISLNPLTGNEEVSVQIEENSTVQPVIEAPETSTVTIEEEEEIVYFEDEVLAALIKRELGLKSNDHITVPDLTSLSYLDLYGVPKAISSLKGLEEAKNLYSLNIGYNNISDLTPLSNLQSLEYIYLLGNQVTDISSLTNLPSLRILDLSDNNIIDVRVFSNFPSLRNLYLDDNQINDISGLLNMPSLERLSLSNNNIIDISGLSDLPSLRELYLADNQISDISSLENLSSLRELSLNNNNISDISVLENLPALRSVRLYDNNISDISALSHLNLTGELDLRNNNITDISPLKSLSFIERLNLSNNNITDIKVLLELPFLRSVDLSGNNITDMETITELINRGIYVQHNKLNQYTEYHTEEIPYDIIYIENPNIFLGREVVSQYGEYGYHESVEIVTIFDGEEINRKVLSDYHTTEPINKIVQVGTKPITSEDLVYFEDDALATFIKKQLGLRYSDEITFSDLLSLTYLDLYGDHKIITSLTGLEEAENLQELWINHNNISDITPLANLQSLRTIHLPGSQIDDISKLTNLPSLRVLNLNDSDISDVSSLVNLPSLKTLYLSNNQISDISNLSNLTSLGSLTLDNNNISDISALSHLNIRGELDLSYNEISDLSPVEELEFLSGLNVSHNNISDLSALESLKFIEHLDLSHNDISEIEVLLKLPILSSVDLTGNNITDQETIRELRNRGTLVYLDGDADGESTLVKEKTRTESIPFKTDYVNNADLPAGTQKTIQKGVAGMRTIIERITLVDGKETKREIISSKVTLQPVNQIVQVSTKEKVDENQKDTAVTAKVERHEGANREEVAIDVAEKHFSEAQKVIIVNQDKFPDAISATNISQGNFPVLYTRADQLGKDTLDFLSSMKSLDEIYLLGGKISISEAVEQLLIEQFGSIITRISGATRFDANSNAIRESYKKADHIIIATGETYTDALYGVSYADTLGAPIILSKTDRLVDASIALLKDLGVKQATIIGGVNSVTKDVEAQLKALGITVNPRIAGKTRYDGSVQVAKSSYKQPSTLLIASGDTFTDALVSAPLAQKLDVPILLVRKDSMVDEVRAYLESHAGSIETIYIQGGPHTISKANEAAIVKAVKPADKPKKAASKSRAHLSKTKEGNISTSEQVLSGLAYRGEEAKDEGVFNRNYSI